MSVACILERRERGKYFGQTPISYHPASANAHTYTLCIHEPFLRYPILLQSPVRLWAHVLVQGYLYSKPDWLQ
jgi:hypothetical protein